MALEQIPGAFTQLLELSKESAIQTTTTALINELGVEHELSRRMLGAVAAARKAREEGRPVDPHILWDDDARLAVDALAIMYQGLPHQEHDTGESVSFEEWPYDDRVRAQVILGITQPPVRHSLRSAERLSVREQED